MQIGDFVVIKDKGMTARPAILDILADFEGSAPDRVLLQALAAAPPERHVMIVQVLLDRAQSVGLQGIPPLLGKLDPDARDLIMRHPDKLYGALRACAKSSNAQTRQNVLEVISESGDARLAYLAAHAMHDGSPRIRAEAADTLLRLARRQADETLQAIAEQTDDPNTDIAAQRAASAEMLHIATRREFIVNALRDALEHYESHHRPQVVEAAMLFALDLEPSLMKQSTLKRGKLSHAIEEILSERLLPEYAPFVYVAMDFPELRRKVVAILARCRDRAFFCEFIRWHWVGRDPDLRRHLVAIRQLGWLNDGFDAVFSLPADVAAMTPSWLLPLGLPVGQKISLLLNLLILEDPAVQRAAVWALSRIDSPDGTTALQGLHDHENEEVRRIAAAEVDRRLRTVNRFQRGRGFKARPDDWARLVQSAGIAEEFESLWQHFERIDPTLARTAGSHALSYISGFATRLQTKLLSKSLPDRQRALRIIQTFAIGPHFEKDVFAAANDTDTDSRATAVATLGQIPGETTRRILERSIADEAPEVQSAAIGSIESLRLKNTRELVLPLTKSDAADVAASAIRCLLRQRVPEAAKALMAMLFDDRPDHRCAALWVVDQLKLHTLEPRLRTIAEADNDRRIARIAEHVARRLAQTAEKIGAKKTEATTTP